eukprot:CAMPEP_0197619516 /NCGR_PEP_ID=MMETSP1338-20131121/527_1 /TAXON_ID=43686 ORGANISM="Pelagodinium beii, Strain RCC1491" /NCGR_SAMPLE_ID=MMETSP1338 /ASSEMBLY_ACC=CAM_ASM_000754 /LENGTH=198 /DNA_ID=CAMNT_0043188493 /DNA_START=64 /DNA_END=660 /DNA_ORIENTATION=+
MMKWAVVMAMGIARLMATKYSAAELREYGSADCTGDFKVLNQDLMDECTPYLIPAPASLKVEQLNDTAYATYHYQGIQDCSGPDGKFQRAWFVEQCEDQGDGTSLKRAWVTGPAPSPPSPGSCMVPGDCGRAYQACCLGSHVKGEPCNCHLTSGTGEATSTDCGTCGKAFVACCSAFSLTGHECTCNVGDSSAATLVI